MNMAAVSYGITSSLLSCVWVESDREEQEKKDGKYEKQ